MTNSSNNSITASASGLESEVETQEIEPSAALLPENSTVQKRTKNALTHGMYAEELVLPWESADDLTKLRNDLWDELQPEGCAEEETAVGIVRLLWLKRRLMRTSQLGYHRDPFSVATARTNPKDWDELVELIVSASDEKASLAKAAKEPLDSLKLAMEKISEIKMACLPGHSQAGPPKEAFEAAQQAQQQANFVSKMLIEQVFPRMTELEAAQNSGAATVYEKAYSSEHLEKTLRIEAALDARIDKQMARLVNLKEYKRLRNERIKEVRDAPSIV